MLNFIANELDHGKRIDVFLNEKLLNLSRSKISRFISEKKVLVNNLFVNKNFCLKIKDIVICDFNDKILQNIEPQDIKLSIVYEDYDVVVINKPKGMLVHPTSCFLKDTLVNALICRYGNNLSNINGGLRPGIVHRLDKNTSGLLLVAKNNDFHFKISEQIKNHDFERKYEVIVYGNLDKNYGIICKNIGRDVFFNRKLKIIDDKNKNYIKKSKFAVTIFRIIKDFFNFKYLEIKLKTGRTHQIRVHLSNLNCPVVGDTLYGSIKNFDFYEGQCLYAKELGFWHPNLNKYLKFSIETPDFFKKTLEKIEKRMIL